MNAFNRLKVGTQLVLGFVLVALIGAFIGVEGILKTGQMHDLADQMYTKETTGLRRASEANAELLAAGRALRNAILADDMPERKTHLDNTQQRLQRVEVAVKEARKTVYSPAGFALVDQIDQSLVQYRQGVAKVVELLQNEELAIARPSTAYVNGPLRAEANKLDGLLDELVTLKAQNAEGLDRQSTEVYQSVRTLLIALTVGGLVVGVLIGVLFARRLSRQLGGEPADVALLANQIAGGDLTSAIDTRQAQPGSVVLAMKHMQDALVNLVTGVRRASDSIATGSNQIAMGNNDLSQRTEEQASNLEQTAASMEELSSTVKSNAETAQQATQLANAAAAAAVDGGQIVGQVVATMGDISESSRQIGDIISVIDGIAFQTNILALNAAVEAARAGEQGRGFAVVAGEVRSLAQRSAEAAKEIKALIGTSVDKVNAGNVLVSRAGEAIEGVVGQVKRVADLMAEINAASAEQTAGISQVGDAVSQLDSVTQQNASLVEEAAAAADSLNQQARYLVEQVSAFRVSGMAHAASAPSPAAARPAPARKPVPKAGHTPAHKAPPKAVPAPSRAPTTPKLASAPAATPPAANRPVKALPSARVATSSAAAGGDEWESF